MDNKAFDALSRLITGTPSRRRIVAAAIGIVVGSAGAGAALARPGKDGTNGPGRKKNICTKASECKTGICDGSLDNKDGQGRCRCRRRNQECTEDRNCCSRANQQMICVGGRCALPVICLDLQAVCTRKDTCCAGVCAQKTYPAYPATRGANPAVCCIETGQSGCLDNADCCNAAAICGDEMCLLLM